MSNVDMGPDELIVLVATCVADGETWVVPDKQFLKILFECAPESGRILNPANYEIYGYSSFTTAVAEGELPVRLEELQKSINTNFACWDEEARCFDTSICSGVADTYAFVNANAVTYSAFGDNVFASEMPADYDKWVAERTGCGEVAKPVAKVESSTERKPWLL